MGFISSSSAGLRQTPGVARFKVLAFFVVCDRVNLLILYEKIFIDIRTCSLYFASLFAAVFLAAGKNLICIDRVETLFAQQRGI